MPDGWDDRVREALRESERRLLDLAHEASADRQYARAAAVLALVDQLARFDPAALPAERAKMAVVPARQPTASAALPVPSSPVVRQVDGQSFPQFRQETELRGQNLIKIGYSKSEKRTYEHRCPREVLMSVAAMIAAMGKPGDVFDSDSLVEANGHRPMKWPTYQIYLCLAFLVQTQLIRKHGRQGYTLNPEHGGAFVDAVAATFASLPVYVRSRA